MHMKKMISLIASLMLLGTFFFSCSSGSDDDDGKNSVGGSGTGSGGKSTESGGKSTESIKVQTSKVKFDFSKAKALAQLEASASSSRAAINVDSLGDFVKILEDGSMENAITVEEGASLSNIVAVYKSPLETSSDVFVVFDSTSHLGEEYKYNEETGETTYIFQNLGQLICVHEDGTVADILNVDPESTDWSGKYINIKSDSVQFDVNGKLYFVSGGGYNLKGEWASGEIIYQFDPSSNQITEMVAAVEGTSYYKLQIDKSGQWIFASGSRSGSYFLRAIPVTNPNGFVNVFYSSSEYIYDNQWVYDDSAGIMYFIARDGNNSGLFTATKAGGFKDKTFHRSYIGQGFEMNLFDSFSVVYNDDVSNPYYWNTDVQTDGKLDAQKAVAYIFERAYHTWEYDYSEPNLEYKEFKLTSDMADIRFDLFKGETGKLRALYLLSKEKKNGEAVKALDCYAGRAALYDIGSTDRYSLSVYSGTSYYEHNFLADILYEKGSDTLLKDSSKVLFSWTDSGGNLHEVAGKDLFPKNDYGYKNWTDIFLTSYYYSGSSGDFIFAFAPEYYADGKLDTARLLEYFFSYCNVEGSKEFRLTAFKDDTEYASLYTELTDKAALDWLASDMERMNLLGKMISSLSSHSVYFWEDNETYYADYQKFMGIISKTCYIAGSENKATTWNDDSGEIIYCSSVDNLTANEQGVFGIYTNVLRAWAETNPYFYIVQLADSQGNITDLQNKLPLPSGKVVSSAMESDRLVLQYSLLDSSGSELGYHHIYAVDLDSGKLTNCFDNVPNRNGLEVVSFSVASDMLYYSAVRGTSVENGIVDIVSNEYNPLSVTRKMVAVYAFK